MKAFFEPLILYIILFFSGSIGAGGVEADVIEFSVSSSLIRIFAYNIPALALIWYLVAKKSGKAELEKAKAGSGDIFSLVLSFPALVLIGFTIALISPLFSGVPPAPQILPPNGFLPWLALFFSCITTGYLEESFFRFYLLSKRREMGLGDMQAAVLSTFLFSLCHIYEGPWGFLNSALSGFILALIFLRYNSIHGISLAHGLYNLMVFALSGL
ncbi:MAG TPA: CPBP family intramembrane metalloprotease [Treponema sp.]|nr:CPBP family intramembrane metalloprotease [Treponema sp.]